MILTMFFDILIPYPIGIIKYFLFSKREKENKNLLTMMNRLGKQGPLSKNFKYWD